jgi:Flp pilus assembly protein TadD
MLALLASGSCASAVDRGEAFLEADNLVGAEQEFRAALLDDPEDPRALYGLGWTYHLAGESGPAQDAFTQLVRFHPDNALGHRGLGSVRMARGDLPGAREALQTAVKLAPDDVRAGQSLALLELNAGDPTEALARIDAVVAREPQSSELLQTRAMILLRSGDAAAALAWSDKALDAATTPRQRATAGITRARAIMTESDGRVDADHCDGAPAVYAWLQAADTQLDVVELTGVHGMETSEARHEIRRRRGYVSGVCPAKGTSTASNPG